MSQPSVVGARAYVAGGLLADGDALDGTGGLAGLRDLHALREALLAAAVDARELDDVGALLVGLLELVAVLVVVRDLAVLHGHDGHRLVELGAGEGLALLLRLALGVLDELRVVARAVDERHRVEDAEAALGLDGDGDLAVELAGEERLLHVLDQHRPLQLAVLVEDVDEADGAVGLVRVRRRAEVAAGLGEHELEGLRLELGVGVAGLGVEVDLLAAVLDGRQEDVVAVEVLADVDALEALRRLVEVGERVGGRRHDHAAVVAHRPAGDGVRVDLRVDRGVVVLVGVRLAVVELRVVGLEVEDGEDGGDREEMLVHGGLLGTGLDDRVSCTLARAGGIMPELAGPVNKMWLTLDKKS